MQKATCLAMSLRGSALTILTFHQTSAVSTRVYSALDNRFGTAHQTELNRVKLKNCARRKEESFPEFAEDIERLIRLAYPDAAPGMVNELVKDQVIDAFPDKDIRLRVSQNKPRSLKETPEYAMDLNSYYQANKHRTQMTREVQMECDSSSTSLPVNKANLDQSSDVLKQLQKCVVDAVHKL